jgi:hypothetical protein
MKLPNRIRAAWIAAIACVLLAAGAFAQYQTGNVYGKVQQKDATPLPGVTVTLTGVGAPQTFITDATGNFRFLNLSPGTYTLKAELAEFGSVTRTGLTVNIGRNADVVLTLIPSIHGEITITAGTELIDTRKAGTGATISQVELKEIPSARDPWVILQQAPGVLVDRVNVGGNYSGQQSNYTAKGVTGDQATWNVDGVNITDAGALGSSPTYYDFDAFEEMQVTTGGSDPRIQTAGVQLNMVTRRGTNDFKGSGRYLLTPGGTQGAHPIPAEATSYLTDVNHVQKNEDRGGEFGGPIMRDKLWFWAAYGQNDIRVFPTARVGQVFPPSHITLKDSNAKLNAQVTASNSGTLFYTRGDKIYLGRNAASNRPQETTFDQSGPTNLYKLEDTQIFGRNFYLTLLGAKTIGGFRFDPEGGFGNGASYRDAAGINHRTYFGFQTNRPQKNARADMSDFFHTGALDHELKFGFGYRDAPVHSQTTWPDEQRLLLASPATCAARGFAAGVTCGDVILYRSGNAQFTNRYNDAYVGDTVIWNNLTLMAGLRWDDQRAGNAASSVAANPDFPSIVPGFNYPGSPTMKWTNVNPRLGFTYTLPTTHRTLIRGGYNRYSDQLAAGTAALSLNPLAGPNGARYRWVDLNGNLHADPGELGAFRFAYGYFDPANPTAGTPFRLGHTTAPRTQEFIAGVEQELFGDVSVGVNYTYRRINNFVQFRFEKTQGAGDFYTPADYIPCSGTDCTSDATGLPVTTVNGHPVYETKDGSTPTYGVITNRPDFNNTFSGFEVFANKRLSNNWMVRGNFSYNDWKQHVGANGFQDPTQQLTISGCSSCNSIAFQNSGTGSGSFGEVYINSKWSYNVTGMYQFPWQISLSAALNGRQGYPYVKAIGVSTWNGTSEDKNVIAETLGDTRFPNIRTVDLRLAKEFRVSQVGLELSASAFNILNSRPVLQRFGSGGNLVTGIDSDVAGQITEIQSPRIFQFGARLNF